MDATGQIFQISKFPNTLSIPVIPGMFRRNLTKICQIYIPKIKWEILAPNGSQTTRATPGDYLASWNRKPIKQRDLLASLTMDKYFRGKVTHCRHFFFYLDRSVERWGGRNNNDHHVWQILVWRRLLWSKSGRKRGAPLVPVTFTKECFLFLTEWYPFFLLGACFFFFFPMDFLPPLNFVKCVM